MAGNMFLALTNILGESLDHDHKMEIEIFEWTWGMSNAAPYRLQESEAAKQTTFQNIVVTKMFDKASTTLMNYCANGKKIDEGTITCRKHDGERPVEYLKIKIFGVKVDSVTWGGRGEDIRGIPEVVNLSFLKFQVIYEVQRRDGSLVGPNEFDFVIPEQKAAPAAAAKK
jgi:type VI secretion system secreted protein Hcp